MPNEGPKKPDPIKATPVVDPTKPPVDPVDPPEFVPKKDFDDLKTSLDAMSLKLDTFGQPQPAPVAPVAPVVDTTAQDLVDINTKITAMDEKIDKAVYDGKGLGSLLRDRDALLEKRITLNNKKEFDTFRTAGVQTLDNLSAQVVQSQMPHLQVPEIKMAYDSALAQMDPSVRMDPNIRVAAYNHAVGINVDKIVDAKVQETLRADPANPQDPSNIAGREVNNPPGGADGIPKPDTILSADNLNAIKSVGKSVDGYYKSLGYKGGWNEFYEANREYYEGVKEDG